MLNNTLTRLHTYTLLIFNRKLTKRACLQLAKAGHTLIAELQKRSVCTHTYDLHFYKKVLKQKLTKKVEGKETVLNNNKKNRYIDLNLNIKDTDSYCL